MSLATELAERGLVPDALLRAGIRRFVAQRLAQEAARAALRLCAAIAVTLACVTARAEPDAAFSAAPRDAAGRFLNRAGVIEQAGASVTFPFFLRRIGTNLAGREPAPERVANDGSFLRENALHSVPTVTWIGHATLVVQMDHVSFVTDPIWSERASPLPVGPRRFVPPGVALDALPAVDFVLVSHNHYDHLDVATLRALAARSPDTVFFVGLGNGEVLRDAGVANVVELDWGGTATHRGVTIHCLESQHWSRRGLLDARTSLWASWAVTGPQRRFYFAGDTGYFAGFDAIGAALGPFDLAALPIGAYEPQAMMKPWHLSPEEAVRAARAVRARRAVGIHWGTFDLSDEPLDEPPRRFRAAADAAGLGAEGAFVLRVGETRDF